MGLRYTHRQREDGEYEAVIQFENGTLASVKAVGSGPDAERRAQNLAAEAMDAGWDAFPPDKKPKAGQKAERAAEAGKAEPDMGWSKAELTRYAEARDIEVGPRDTKKKILKAIKAA